MAGYDALRHVSLGQYYPAQSGIHRLDPRAKMVFVALGTVAIVTAPGGWSSVALTIGVLAAGALAQLPARHLWSIMRPVLPVFAVLAVFQLLFNADPPAAVDWESSVLLSLGRFTLTLGGLVVAISSILRLVSLVLLVGLLMSTTTVSAITRGIETLLRPLDRVGLPGHELAMVFAIALRFMPILGEELESILLAQASRGAGLVHRSRWRVADNARGLARVVVSLFVDAFRRVDEMTMAMLARCYQGGRGRTHLVDARLGPWDYGAIGAGALALAATIAFR